MNRSWIFVGLILTLTTVLLIVIHAQITSVAGSFFLSSGFLSQPLAEAKTYGVGCELSLNINKKVFYNGDSVIVYGNSPYNAELAAAMLPVRDDHVFRTADIFKGQGCHYAHVLGKFSNNQTGYYWVAITEAHITGITQGDPNDVEVILYNGKR